MAPPDQTDPTMAGVSTPVLAPDTPLSPQWHLATEQPVVSYRSVASVTKNGTRVAF